MNVYFELGRGQFYVQVYRKKGCPIFFTISQFYLFGNYFQLVYELSCLEPFLPGCVIIHLFATNEITAPTGILVVVKSFNKH